MTHSTACTPTPNAFSGPCNRQIRRHLGARWLCVWAFSTNRSSTWLTRTATRQAAATHKPLRAPLAFPLNGSRLVKANPIGDGASQSTSALHYTTASARRANSLRDWNASHKHWKTARAGTSAPPSPVGYQHQADRPADDVERSQRPPDQPTSWAGDPATASTPGAKCQWRLQRLTSCPQGARLLWTFPCEPLKHALDKYATTLYAHVSMLSP